MLFSASVFKVTSSDANMSSFIPQKLPFPSNTQGLDARCAPPAKWDQLARQHAVAVHDDVFDSPFTSTRRRTPRELPPGGRPGRIMTRGRRSPGFSHMCSHADVKNIMTEEERGTWREKTKRLRVKKRNRGGGREG